MSDEMIEIARLVSRPEAITLRAMFDAAGIMAHIGGDWHGSANPMVLALGGYRLTVPRDQYRLASDMMREVLSRPAEPVAGYRRRIVRLLLVIFATTYLPIWIAYALSGQSTGWWQTLGIPATLLLTPVPPRGRGDYYLAEPTA